MLKDSVKRFLISDEYQDLLKKNQIKATLYIISVQRKKFRRSGPMTRSKRRITVKDFFEEKKKERKKSVSIKVTHTDGADGFDYGSLKFYKLKNEIKSHGSDEESFSKKEVRTLRKNVFKNRMKKSNSFLTLEFMKHLLSRHASKQVPISSEK